MEVNDDGEWAFFDDTEGFTAPASHHPASNRTLRNATKTARSKPISGLGHRPKAIDAPTLASRTGDTAPNCVR